MISVYRLSTEQHRTDAKYEVEAHSGVSGEGPYDVSRDDTDDQILLVIAHPDGPEHRSRVADLMFARDSNAVLVPSRV